MEKAFFRDGWLIVVKADFDQRMTMPILDLKRWTERVSAKTHSSSRPNSDYIPGAGVLRGWNLTRTGRFAQTYATRAFHKGSVVRVWGVYNQLGGAPLQGDRLTTDGFWACLKGPYHDKETTDCKGQDSHLPHLLTPHRHVQKVRHFTRHILSLTSSRTETRLPWPVAPVPV